MQPRRFLLATLVMLITAALSGAAEVEMLAPGELDGDATMIGTSRWLGLYVDGRTFELRPVEVAIEGDTGELNAAGWALAITVPDAPVPLLLLRGGRLAAGQVPTAFAGDTSLPRGGSLSMSLDGEVSVLLVEAAKGMEQEDEVPARMVLVRGREEQALAVSEDSDEIYPGFDSYPSGHLPHLLWAGDIDGDNHLDLLLDRESDGELRTLVLYLSSEAQSGELVHVAARAALFVPDGC